jgi:hypothetical protein
MGDIWNPTDSRIDVQLTSSESTGNVAFLFEGSTAKRVEIRRARDGMVLLDVLNCMLQPGDPGNNMYRKFSLPVTSMDTTFWVTPFHGDAPCSSGATVVFMDAQKKEVEHLDKTYHSDTLNAKVQVHMNTYHLSLGGGDNLHITITIEDVIQ